MSAVETHTSADYALQFDGINKYIDLGEPSSLKSENFTLATWFKRLGPGATADTGLGGVLAEPLVTKGRGESDGNNKDMNYFLGIRQSDLVLAADFEDFTNGSNHPVTGTTVINDDTWYHAAATYDGSEWKLYLNGILEANLTVGKVPRYDSIQDNAVGTALTSGGIPQGYFNGTVDEVAIWEEALDTTEITAIYNSGNSLDVSSNSGNYQSASNLQGYWNFNEASGNTVTDLSNNSNHGTLINGPTRVSGTGVASSTTRTLTITDPNTTSYEIAYDLTDTTVDFSGQGLDIEIDTSDASAMTSALLSSSKTFTIPETRRLTITDENGVQQSLQYQVGNDTSLDFSELGIELDIAGSYSGGLNGTQIEISADRDLQVGAVTTLIISCNWVSAVSQLMDWELMAAK